MQTVKHRKSFAGGDRVPVLVDGIRSPFVKSFGEFANLDCLELFSRTVSAFIRKLGMDVGEIDEISAGRGRAATQKSQRCSRYDYQSQFTGFHSRFDDQQGLHQ